ncbi:related to CCR4 - transcriptional regulator involved in carbon catabolite repression [Melanopsichium pennsylvanicum]|uniref:CCR4-Not complex 3'-5'-exoribonuclease subunit Ccr4 n=2 Tax=Melanopsichium pennsylvanicum TaxID=63383 RepID=A0AAJ4XNM8_9BASI|nr:related to CCR4-component of the major cytoplasmic deadenylase (C-terminal fragment) [Melanopsichium pennsylvanicum 4]SNX85106.1 related to CCR4 - transcriptional regulator involved in carbon catabolite repression [Melanopsichium pennsylvanicum]
MYPSPSPSPAPSPPAYLYLNNHHHHHHQNNNNPNHAGGPLSGAGGQASAQNHNNPNGYNASFTPVARFPMPAAAWPQRAHPHPHHTHQQNPSLSSLPGSIGHSSAASVSAAGPSSPGYGSLGAHHHHHHGAHGPSGLSHMASPGGMHSGHLSSSAARSEAAAAAAAAAAASGSPHWQQQIVKAEISRQSNSPHHHARAAALAARSATSSAIAIQDPNKGIVPPQVAANGLFVAKKDSSSANGGGGDDGKGSGAADATGTTNGGASTTTASSNAATKDKQTWSTIDMGGLALKNIANEVYRYSFLTSLFINHNSLTTISSDIVKLRHLTVLDASGNKLTSVPAELGMLTSLRELFLFDNNLVTLPPELGTLHQLEMLGIEGNPLQDNLRTLFQREGTSAVIAYLRDSCPVPLPPPEREWIMIDADLPDIDNDKSASQAPQESFNVLSYNILCDRYATAQMYGYTPSWALAWDYRKEFILQELMSYSADICCLQEVDMEQYEDYFLHHLSQQDYEGVFYPKSRARTMRDEEKRRVDGCAIFYKSNKYQLIEKQLVEFNQIALQRPDFKKSEDMYNRVMTKDNIAVIALLENKLSGSRLVVANVHTHWDPQFRDVKLVQVAIVMDEVEKAGSRFAKLPPKPSVAEGYPPPPKYTHGNQIPTIVCGDFNSVPETGVYDFLSNGAVPGDHDDFMDHVYGNYTAQGLEHCYKLESSYAPIGELPFTNYTPGYEGGIDYIFYTKNTLNVTGVLGEVDKQYLGKVVGFPNAHFPSDHICIMSEFKVKEGTDGNGDNKSQGTAREVHHPSSSSSSFSAPKPIGGGRR